MGILLKNILVSLVLIAIVVVSFILISNNANKKVVITYPFFVSTRDSVTNIRSGPSLDYPIIWIYNHKMIPMKVIASDNEWYQIEDISGKKGWVYKNLTLQQKTAIVVEESDVYISPKYGSKLLAVIKEKNIVNVIKCRDSIAQVMCEVKINTGISPTGSLSGWVLQSNLWGNTS